MQTNREVPQYLAKITTRIQGFDEVRYDELPRTRVSLLKGGPGSGKTVFALQSLVSAARQREEAGIFVAFEERPQQIIANAAGFQWDLATLLERKLFFIDANLSPDVFRSGEFDLRGMLAMLKAKKEEIGARWIVFDGVDVLLTRLQNPKSEIREIYRIRDWLAENRVHAAIFTAKIDRHGSPIAIYGFLQFMVDCIIEFESRLECGIAIHRIRVTKYRGSDFVKSEYPVRFGSGGMEIAGREPIEIQRWEQQDEKRVRNRSADLTGRRALRAGTPRQKRYGSNGSGTSKKQNKTEARNGS
jgi:circadian clock protein KaiC